MQPAVGEYMTRPERPLMSDDPAASTNTAITPSRTVSSTQPGEYLDMSGASRRASGAAAAEGDYYETVDVGATKQEDTGQYINMSIK